MASNADVVRRIYDYLSLDELVAATELLDDDFELDVTTNVFNPAVYRGRDELLRWREGVSDVWEQFDMEAETLEEFGDKLLAYVRVLGRGRGSGVELSDHIWQVWTVREGRAVSCRVFAQDEEGARRAATAEE